MTEESSRCFNISLARAYYEVARAIAGPIPFSIPQNPDDAGMNALVGWTSIPVVYSYLAVEAFVTYHLYRLWTCRQDGSEVSRRFLQALGDENSFERYGGHKEFREPNRRVRLLCRISGYREPQAAIPSIWQDFNDLLRKRRRFLVHPRPDPASFQEITAAILHQQPLDRYVGAAREMIGFYYDEAGTTRPEWLNKNELIRIIGVELFPEQK